MPWLIIAGALLLLACVLIALPALVDRWTGQDKEEL